MIIGNELEARHETCVAVVGAFFLLLFNSVKK